jgi:hypothetical protein
MRVMHEEINSAESPAAPIGGTWAELELLEEIRSHQARSSVARQQHNHDTPQHHTRCARARGPAPSMIACASGGHAPVTLTMLDVTQPSSAQLIFGGRQPR